MNDARGVLRVAVLALAVLAVVGTAVSASAVPVRPGAAVATQFAQGIQCVCHGMLLGEWQQSVHSKALDDPVFRVKVEEADAATGGTYGTFCRRCHAPVANMTGQDGTAEMSPAAAQGVGCSFCHQVSAMRRPLGDVSHELEPTGVMRAQLKDAAAPHFTRFSALHTSSEFCGGCHDLKHPGSGVVLLSTYSEWKKSPQGLNGTQCQDCHMSEAPPAVGPSTGYAAEAAPQRDNIYHMTFTGAQVALGNRARALALLQSAATVEIDAPDVLPEGTTGAVRVSVRNIGAGHYLPTGVTELRQMWLSVLAVDSSGHETEIGRRTFGTEFKDAKGNHPVEVQDVAGIAEDDRIPPLESVTETCTLALPAGASAVEVRARLLYASVPDELAKRAGVENPTTTMAEAAKRVYATEAAKTAGGAEGTTSVGAGQGASVRWAPVICLGLVLVAGIGVATAVFRARQRSPDDSV